MTGSRKLIVATAAILAPSVWFFCTAASLPHVAVLTGLLLVASCFRRRALPVTHRTLIYGGLAAVLLTVLLDYVFPMSDDRFGFLSLLLHPEIVVPVLFYATAISTFFRRDAITLGVAAAAALAGLTFCGDIQNGGYHVAAARDGDVPVLFLYFEVFYPGAIGVSLLAVLGSIRWLEMPHGSSWHKRLLSLGAMALVPLLVCGLYWGYRTWENELRQLESFLLRAGMRRASGWRQRAGVFMDSRVDLKQTLAPELQREQSAIMIEAVGRTPPGYLRGRVYVVYADGEWTTLMEPFTQLPFSESPGTLAERVFRLDPETSGTERWDLFLSSRLRSFVLYHPGGATHFALIADRVNVSREGTLEMTDFVRDGGCTIFGWRGDIASPYPAGGELSPYLRQVPEALRSALQEVLYVNGIHYGITDAEKFRRLLTFFRNSFQYSLDVKGDDEMDPVLYFLNRSRRGHCELFASAMVLLLRQAGVPARYVTGFICEEPHVSGRSYLARLGNAHAWVEAYDRDQQKWMLLEPTPAIPAVPPRDYEMLRQYGEWGTLLARQLLALLRRGRFASALLEVGSVLGDLALVVLRCPFFYLIPGGLALWFGWRYRKRRVHALRYGPDPERRKLAAEYRKRLRRLRRMGMLARREEPTAGTLLERLDGWDLPPELREDLRRYLREYCRSRYRVDAVADLRKKTS